LAERLNLREFQAQLAEKLKGAARHRDESAKLGFLAGGRHWLTDLDQVSEMVTVPGFSRAPWAQPWFLGVTGVRGVIYGCTDLAAFLGLQPVESPEDHRLLLAHPRFGAHAALRIEQALGLRNVTGMQRLPPQADDPGWVKGRFQDRDGLVWTELSIGGLVANPRFLQAAA
jgi:twitching motility protein PilI